METLINPDTDNIMEDGFTLGGGKINVKIVRSFLTPRRLIYWIVQEVVYVIYVLRLSPKLKAYNGMNLDSPLTDSSNMHMNISVRLMRNFFDITSQQRTGITH